MTRHFKEWKQDQLCQDLETQVSSCPGMWLQAWSPNTQTGPKQDGNLPGQEEIHHAGDLESLDTVVGQEMRRHHEDSVEGWPVAEDPKMTGSAPPAVWQSHLILTKYIGTYRQNSVKESEIVSWCGFSHFGFNYSTILGNSIGFIFPTTYNSSGNIFSCSCSAYRCSYVIELTSKGGFWGQVTIWNFNLCFLTIQKV